MKNFIIGSMLTAALLITPRVFAEESSFAKQDTPAESVENELKKNSMIFGTLMGSLFTKSSPASKYCDTEMILSGMKNHAHGCPAIEDEDIMLLELIHITAVATGLSTDKIGTSPEEIKRRSLSFGWSRARQTTEDYAGILDPHYFVKGFSAGISGTTLQPQEIHETLYNSAERLRLREIDQKQKNSQILTP